MLSFLFLSLLLRYHPVDIRVCRNTLRILVNTEGYTESLLNWYVHADIVKTNWKENVLGLEMHLGGTLIDHGDEAKNIRFYRAYRTLVCDVYGFRCVINYLYPEAFEYGIYRIISLEQALIKDDEEWQKCRETLYSQ